jgi:hypothetical protein
MTGVGQGRGEASGQAAGGPGRADGSGQAAGGRGRAGDLRIGVECQHRGVPPEDPIDER